MQPADLSPSARAALREAFCAERVDDGYEAFVVRHLNVDDASWRWCCGSSCDPCVERLGRVVDRVRAAVQRESDGDAAAASG